MLLLSSSLGNQKLFVLLNFERTNMSRKPRNQRAEKSRHREEMIPSRDENSEILNVLRHQSEYIDHVERENRLLKVF